jgi:probable F420-dependent oxidoreductase
MKFSVHIPTAAEGLAHPIPFATPDDLVRIAVAAETWGFDGVWGNDHQTTQAYVRERWPSAPNYYDVLVSLSFVAAATKRIHLGTALLIPAMRSLPATAKQVATLDRFSNGRFRLGVGVGAYREELEAVSPDRSGAHRGAWLDESIQAFRALFDERSASFEGRYVRFNSVESFPKPSQVPLPIYVGGHNLEAVERAARWGQGWLPGWRPLPEMEQRIALLRERTVAAGRAADAVEVAPQLSVTMGRTHEAAEAAYLKSGLMQHRLSLAYTGRDLSKQTEANLIGTPEEIAAKVERYREMGVEHCCALWFGTDTVVEMLEQMQWFAETVIRPTAALRTPVGGKRA